MKSFMDQKFVNLSAPDDLLEEGEYEYCTFENCDLADSDLSHFRFINCNFKDTNFSNCKLGDTSFQEASFENCKMLGLLFSDCCDFKLSFGFKNCLLDHSTFQGKSIKKTIFENSRLYEVDFSESDISGSVFADCDLTRATFESTILEKVDFRNAANYSLDPYNNKVKGAKFSIHGLPGLLGKFNIDIEK